MKKQIPKDQKEKYLHLTRPPRLEGAVKNAMMDPVKKKRKIRPKEEKRKKT